MLKRNSDIDELIATWFTGEATENESKELKEWIDASTANREHFLRMQEVWFSSVSDSDALRFDKNAAYDRFLQKSLQLKKQRTGRQIIRPIVGTVAAAVLVLAVSLFAYRQGGNRVKNQFTDIAIEAPSGSRTKLLLPDNTLVWLNAGSKISYSQGYGVNERTVRLWGEGYFEVARNEKLPMKVITDELSVEVLGTIFNFRNYPDEEEAVVSLEEGSVISLNRLKEGQKFVLAPDQKVILNKKTKDMLLTCVVAKNVSGWIDGNLFFDEKLLSDIIKTLARSYGVKIRIGDASLSSFRFYGQFSRTENTIQDVLERLVATQRLEYIMDVDEIVLIPKINK